MHAKCDLNAVDNLIENQKETASGARERDRRDWGGSRTKFISISMRFIESKADKTQSTTKMKEDKKIASKLIKS